MVDCPKCLHKNEAGADYCTECGAPLADSAEGSDQAIYAELATANLMRARGDHKAASDACLSVLRRFPNNATAHSLLGDVYSDQGDLSQAKTWYELALELVPDSSADRQKLAVVNERLAHRESTETAQLIGVPPRQTPVWLYLAAVALLLGTVAVGAFSMGRSGQKQKPEAGVIERPVNLESSQPKETTEPDKKLEPDTPVSNEPATEPVKPNPSDGALLTALQQKRTENLTYLGAVEDPRGPSALVTVQATTEGPNVTATRAGLEFFRVFPAYSKVTIRVLDDTGIRFVADMSRDAAKTAEAAIAGGDTVESQSQVMLIQPWVPPHKSEPSSGAESAH